MHWKSERMKHLQFLINSDHKEDEDEEGGF